MSLLNELSLLRNINNIRYANFLSQIFIVFANVTGVLNIYNKKYSLTSYSGGNYLIQYFCISFKIMHFFIILQAINIDHLKAKIFHESKKIRLELIKLIEQDRTFIDHNYILISLDVIFLFTNIPTD